MASRVAGRAAKASKLNSVYTIQPLLLAPTVLVGAGLALYPWQTSRAEAAAAAAVPNSAAASAPVIPPSSAAPRLSIYDSPSSPIVLTPEDPSALQLHVSSARKTSEVLYDDARSRLRKFSNEWVGLEQKMEHEVKSIRAPDEQLTPGILYVGVSTLLGSILTRSRSFPLRFLTPPLFLIASSTYFLPKTTHNVNLYTQALEKAYIPSVYEQQVKAVHQANKAWVQLRSAGKDLSEKGRQLGDEGARKLGSSSGLKLQSAERPRVDEKLV